MKNTRKGFTLVELLVVIAILAILATVSVVGYTAFIERASISNDQNVVAQLNNYLEAYKADHTSNFYGKDINEYNYMFLVDEIFEGSELGEYEAQAEEYGYYIVFNYEGDVDEFLLAHRDDVVNGSSGIRMLLNVFADEDKNVLTKTPGTSPVKDDKQYGFIHTTNSDLAKILKVFHSSEDVTREYLNEIHDLAVNYTQKYTFFTPLKVWLENTIFVTVNGNFTYDSSLGEFVKLDKDAANANPNDKTVTGNVTGEKNIVINKEVEADIGIPEFTGNVNAGTPVINNSNATITNLGSGDNTDYTIVNNGEGKIDASLPDDIKVTTGDNPEDKAIKQGKDLVDAEDNTVVIETLVYGNPVKDFDISSALEFVTNIDPDAENTDNKIYVAWDKIANEDQKYELALVTRLEQGIKAGVPSKLEYYWYVDSITYLKPVVDATTGETTYVEEKKEVGNLVTVDQNGVVKFSEDYAEKLDIAYITVKATNVLDKNGNDVVLGDDNKPVITEYTTTKSVDIHIAAITNVGFKMAGKTWVWDGTQSEYKVTLIHDNTNGNAYTLENEIVYNNKISGITLDENVTIEFEVGADDSVLAIGEDKASVTTKKSGTTTLVVKIGQYKTYKIEIVVVDVTGDLALQAKNQNITLIGNGNAIELGDLFVGNIPDNANLIVFNGIANDSDYMTPSINSPLLKANDSSASLYVDDAAYKLVDATNKTSYANGKPVSTLTDTIKFAGSKVSGDKISIAIFSNGVRVSPNVNVYVVDAYNVKTWDQLSTNIANNVVFLSDISMPSGNTATLDVSTHTLYGNGHKFDITTGKRGGQAGIITLKTGGVIRDVRIVGAVYSTFAVSVSDDYGTSAVDAAGGSIINSYIANCRSPLRIESGEVFVKDSVLFGGRYANIDMVGGKVTIQGKVATVGQPIKDASGKTVLGTGITVWFNNTEKVVNLDTGAELKQYNFIQNDSAVKKSLPVINYYSVVKISTSDMFSQLFGSDYSAYHYKDSNGTIYVSAGIGSLDKYMDTNKSQDTLKLTGFADGVYSGSVIYSYNISDIAYAIVKSKLAEKGINSNPLQMDVRTLQPSNAANAKLFEEYLQLGTYYYPENYTFSNGSVHFKTFPAAE